MKNNHFILSLLLICYFKSSFSQQSNKVDITPEFQQTPEWCWVTSSSMVLQHYNIPCVNPAGDYQCGLIGWFFGPNSSCYYNCFTCPVPAKSLFDISNLFSLYPPAAGTLVNGTPMHLKFDMSGSHLSKSQIKQSIDNDSPILTGISPSGFYKGISEHVTVIVGYDEDENGILTLTVNDPFPYDLTVFNSQNPYIKAGGVDNKDGSYSIGFVEYVSYLQWHESIYNFESY